MVMKIYYPADKPIPKGTAIHLVVPVDDMEEVTEDIKYPQNKTEPVPAPDPEEAVTTEPPLNKVEEVPPTEEPVKEEPTDTIPDDLLLQSTFFRKFDDPKFRKEERRFEKLGSATELNLSGQSWTMRLAVTFVDFGSNQRVIGSSSHSGPGSSLQIGTLKGGRLWLDTFQGAIVGPILEKNIQYDLWVSMDHEGREMMYLGDEIVASGKVPNFVSNGDIYVGRWLNSYHSFDLESVTIYPYLIQEDIRAIRSS